MLAYFVTMDHASLVSTSSLIPSPSSFFSAGRIPACEKRGTARAGTRLLYKGRIGPLSPVEREVVLLSANGPTHIPVSNMKKSSPGVRTSDS